MAEAPRMFIGEVATQAGVNIDTVRYYEKRGLLKEPQRRPSGYREYPPDTVRLLHFIKRAQELGFTLAEIEELLSLREAGGKSRPRVRKLAQTKLRDIDQKLADLQALRGALFSLLDSCECSDGKPSCPILDALNQNEAPEISSRTSRRRNGKA